MSEQSRVKFERVICKNNSRNIKKNENGEYELSPIAYAYSGWQSATTEANKRIEALEGEVAELNNWKNQAIEVENEWDVQAVGRALNIQLGHSIRAGILHKINELQANNHDLREALRNILGAYTKLEAENIATDALSTIPAESLQAHDNEVISKITILVNDETGNADLVARIEALKGATHERTI